MLMVIMTMSAVLAQLQNTKKDQTAHVLTKESSLNTLDNMHYPATKLSNLVNAYMCKNEEGACSSGTAATIPQDQSLTYWISIQIPQVPKSKAHNYGRIHKPW